MVGQIDVVYVVELVVHAHRDRVRAAIQNQIVGKGDDVLRQGVRARVTIGSDVGRNASRGARVADYHARHVGHVGRASVAHARVTDAQRVVQTVGDARFEHGGQVVRRAVIGVSRADERERSERVAVLLGPRVEIAVTQRQMVAVVDVPVEAGQKRSRTLFHVASAVTASVEARNFAIARRDAVQFRLRQSHALVTEVVRRRRGLGVVFAAQEQEQLVFDDGAAQRNAVDAGGLVVELLASGDVAARCGAVKIPIVIIGVGAAAELVGARFGDGVYDAARESAHAHVVRGRRHLDLRQSVERDGIGVRQSAVGARRGEPVHVVVGHAVDHEGVVAVVHAAVRYASVFGRHGLRHEAHDVVKRTRHGGHLRYGLFVIYVRHAPVAGVARLDHHFGQTVVFVQHDVLGTNLAHAQAKVPFCEVVAAHIARFEHIAVVGLDAVDGEAALAVGRDAVRRSRYGMRHNDGGAC